MVEGNLRLVLSVVQRFAQRGENLDDLFQVGCIGLIKAIDNFDPAQPVRFSTYGVPMIIGEIRRFLRDNNALRVSRSLRDTAYRAMQSREALEKQLGREPTMDEIAQAAGLAALEETAYVEKVRALIAEQRPRLTAGLRALGLRVLDGRANYLLFQAPETLGEALRQRGAVLRSCANYPGLGPGWYRTAVRTRPENEQLLKLLAEVLE